MAGQPLTCWHFSDLRWDVQSSTERQGFLKTLSDHSGAEAQLPDVEQGSFRIMRRLMCKSDCLLFLSQEILMYASQKGTALAEKEFVV